MWRCVAGRLAVDASEECSVLPRLYNTPYLTLYGYLTLKIKALPPFETSKTTHRITQCHVPKYLNIQEAQVRGDALSAVICTVVGPSVCSLGTSDPQGVFVVLITLVIL